MAVMVTFLVAEMTASAVKWIQYKIKYLQQIRKGRKMATKHEVSTMVS